MPMKMPFGPQAFQKINWPMPNLLMSNLPGFETVATGLMKQTFKKKGVATIAQLREACVEEERLNSGSLDCWIDACSNPIIQRSTNPILNVADWTQKEILLRDLGQLYQDLAGEWLLLERFPDFPLNDLSKKIGAEEGLPTKFRLHAHHPDKDKLREFMLEHDDWDWSKKFLFVLADPEKPCEISS